MILEKEYSSIRDDDSSRVYQISLLIRSLKSTLRTTAPHDVILRVQAQDSFRRGRPLAKTQTHK